MRRFAWQLVAATAFVVPIPGQRTWVVDGAGGGDFRDIQPAVDASAPGDRIEIRAGRYGGFAVRTGIDIDGAAGVIASGPVVVTDLPAGQWLRLCGIEV